MSNLVARLNFNDYFKQQVYSAEQQQRYGNGSDTAAALAAAGAQEGL